MQDRHYDLKSSFKDSFAIISMAAIRVVTNGEGAFLVHHEPTM